MSLTFTSVPGIADLMERNVSEFFCFFSICMHSVLSCLYSGHKIVPRVLLFKVKITLWLGTSMAAEHLNDCWTDIIKLRT